MVIKKKTKKKKSGKKIASKGVRKSVAKKTSRVVKKKSSRKVTKKKVSKKKVTRKVAKKKVTKKTTKKISKKVSKNTAKKVTKKAAGKKTGRGKVAKKFVKKNKEQLQESIVSPIATKDVLKETLDFLRTFDFLASDSDECLERKCDNPATTGAYCRLHYIKNWKEIKNKEKIFQEGTLIDYIEQLTKKFSVKVVDTLLEDMSDEKNFYNALKNMNIDVSEEFFDDTDDSSDDSDIPFENKSKSHIYDDE